MKPRHIIPPACSERLPNCHGLGPGHLEMTLGGRTSRVIGSCPCSCFMSLTSSSVGGSVVVGAGSAAASYGILHLKFVSSRKKNRTIAVMPFRPAIIH